MNMVLGTEMLVAGEFSVSGRQVLRCDPMDGKPAEESEQDWAKSRDSVRPFELSSQAFDPTLRIAGTCLDCCACCTMPLTLALAPR